eukprot:Gb_16352 [translate_table: standard]
MVGFLDKELPHKSQRDAWFEVNNQILNALFTLMCLYHHPGRFYHLTLLCRWNPDDVVNLRKIYCKNGTYKPHEWTHMMVVVLLLHLNCFAQYALCALNWGYKRSERPAIGVGICIAFAIGAPAAAGLYNILSPLGKEYEIEADLEAVNNTDTLQLKWNSEIDLQKEGTCIDKSNIKMFQKRYFFASRESKRLELEPKWNGGILDCWTDPAVAIFSCLGGFCVFGWNMDRLGFGNMYVHIVTFILLCMAPFWIFNLAAVNIDNARVREFLCITGIVLCVFGLLYGGFWRIQMRKRFNLPASRWCFGQPNATDCAQWLFCSLCSLCQEVRTADFYDICEEKMYATQPPNQNSLGHAGTSTGSSSLCQEHRSPMLQSTVGNSPSCVALVQSPLNAPAPLSFSRSPIDLFQGSANSACLSPLPQHEGLPVLSPQYLSSPMFESPIQNSLASDSESELKEECQVKMPEAKDSWTPTSALVFQPRREKCMEL